MPRNKRKKVTVEDFGAAIQKMMHDKTDRECAILGGALIEGMLFDILEETVVDSKHQKAKDLFDYPRPLSSFGNIVSLAFAFGVISEQEFNVITIIKKIRNYAAHSIGLAEGEEFDFSKDPVRRMLFEFYPKVPSGQLAKEITDQVKDSLDSLMSFDPNLGYRMIFSYAGALLIATLETSERLMPPPDR